MVATIIMPTLNLDRAAQTIRMAKATAGVVTDTFVYYDHKARGAVRSSNALFSAAVDMGEKYIVYLNDDTVPEQQGWLKTMIGLLEQNDKWGFGSPSGECSTVPQRNGKPGDPIRAHIINKPLAWFCAVIKRECLVDVGVFDPRFIHYGDESDWIQRAFRKGWRQIWTEGVYIKHLRGSGGENKALRDQWARHDKRLYRKRWAGGGGKKKNA